ncbi:YceI family protein [Hymenobacter chitinivorans]|uniref:Polyisoprenoid-binding protein YceI n=1 Tax=Hymenobacter chitinivorans DSM 11115 TaxID=1121954 RepID=A0A2M9BAI7_9BACT|nr:YceI family protein [Hymenobacter chitinivorans]PJJ54947.1 polyisoprenoid-binding protein YceI [Hymenobacter chitinivorans DSM 11115]
MKKRILLMLLAAAALGAPSLAARNGVLFATESRKPTPGTYVLQPQLSTLGWLAKKVTGQHNGTVQFQSGQVLVKGSQIVGGTFTVDMTSIKDNDQSERLVGHLKSDDFFGVDKNPTATFVITSVTPIKGAAKDADNVTITGDLTIKGKTNPLSFPAKAGVKSGVAAASGTATIDRTKYDIRYRSKSFFESIGDKAIDDAFTLTFNVIAKADGVATR